jgi:hypothetical protein
MTRKLFVNPARLDKNALILLVYSEPHTPMLLLEIPNQAILENIFQFKKRVKPVISFSKHIQVC